MQLLQVLSIMSFFYKCYLLWEGNTPLYLYIKETVTKELPKWPPVSLVGSMVKQMSHYLQGHYTHHNSTVCSMSFKNAFSLHGMFMCFLPRFCKNRPLNIHKFSNSKSLTSYTKMTCYTKTTKMGLSGFIVCATRKKNKQNVSVLKILVTFYGI